MDMKNIRTISIVLLVLVFISPILGTLISSVGQSSETNQYAGLQWGLMGVYNLPFFIASLVGLLLGNSFSKRQKSKASVVSFSISITSSVIGTILMLVWGLGGR